MDRRVWWATVHKDSDYTEETWHEHTPLLRILEQKSRVWRKVGYCACPLHTIPPKELFVLPTRRCSGDPNKVLPEFLIWSLINFYWLRRSRTLGSNKDTSPETLGPLTTQTTQALGPLGPQPGTLGLGSTTSGLALARDPGLTHQWASISPGPTEPKPHPPDHGPDASPVNPSPLTSRPAPPRTPWPDHSTNQQNDTSSRTPCSVTSQKVINYVYNSQKCHFFIRQLFHKNQHGKDQQLNE